MQLEVAFEVTELALCEELLVCAGSEQLQVLRLCCAPPGAESSHRRPQTVHHAPEEDQSEEDDDEELLQVRCVWCLPQNRPAGFVKTELMPILRIGFMFL